MALIVKAWQHSRSPRQDQGWQRRRFLVSVWGDHNDDDDDDDNDDDDDDDDDDHNDDDDDDDYDDDNDDLQQDASRQAEFVWPEVSEGQARTQSPQLIIFIRI